MPDGQPHSGAAADLPNTVGAATGREERPFASGNLRADYGSPPNTMEITQTHVTPTEANPPSVSELRLANTQAESRVHESG